MMICPQCSNALEEPSEGRVPACTACGWTAERMDGFVAYAPAFARGGGGFDASYFQDLAECEGRNFWFRARSALIIWALKKYHPAFRSFMEIGCGTGYVLSGIAEAVPQARLLGSEIFVEGLRFAAERLATATLMQMDARAIPFANEFDAIGAFDVLEHIEEDERVLGEMHKALVSGGTLLVSVPQHPWLWSPTDDFAHHCRRYTARELRSKVEAAGFEVVRDTSFVSLLLPAMLASRLVTRQKPVEEIEVRDELTLPPLVNRVFEGVMALERSLIKAGLDLPVGGSRLIVARKRA